MESRGGVDEVAGDHPLALGADGDRGLARQNADPDLEIDARLASERRDHVDEIESGSDRALGIVLEGDRGAPHRHHGVADEFLDDAAVPVDDDPGPLEVAVLEVSHRLRVAVGGDGREADEIGEQDRDHTSFRGHAA